MTHHKFYFAAVVIFLTLAVPCVFSNKVTKIIYRVSARNLPANKNAFAEIQKDKLFYCRTESVKSENPDWIEICETEFREGENDTRLAVETRHNQSGPDESIGWSVFFVRDMLENGKMLQEEIRNGADPRGTMRITVLLACVPGEPGCGLPQKQQSKAEPLLDLKIYA